MVTKDELKEAIATLEKKLRAEFEMKIEKEISELKDEYEDKIKLLNTSIDNLVKENKDLTDKFETTSRNSYSNSNTSLVDKLSWNEAKKLWLLNVCKLQFTVNRNKKKTISTFGTEYEFYICYSHEFQRFESNESCQNKKCRKSSTF
jgi:hypothetical protein